MMPTCNKTLLFCVDHSLVGPSRCLDAFTIALNQVNSSSGWYSSTLQLQLASLQFCVVCRSVSTLHLLVKDGMPTLMFEDAPVSDVKVKKGRCTRVPAIQPLILTLELSVWLSRFSSETLANVAQLTLLEGFNDELNDVAWPSSLQQLTFGEGFNQATTELCGQRRYSSSRSGII